MAETKTVKREVLPYLGLNGYIAGIRYRHSTSAKFEELHGTPAAVLVPVEDLRAIPRHEIALMLNDEALPKEYSSHLDKLSLVIIVSDNTIRNEQVVHQSPLDNLPETFVLDSRLLKKTSCRTELPIEISICASTLNGGAPWPGRRASRLASWRLTIVNQNKGPQFPWQRKTGDEFEAAGFPQTSTFFISLASDPSSLLTDADAEVSDLLEVWVHEDVWVVLQQPESSAGIASLQRLFVSQVTGQILELVVEPLKKNVSLVEGSVLDCLLRHIAHSAKCDPDDLRQRLKVKGASDLAPIVTAAYGVNRAVTKVLDIN